MKANYFIYVYLTNIEYYPPAASYGILNEFNKNTIFKWPIRDPANGAHMCTGHLSTPN